MSLVLVPFLSKGSGTDVADFQIQTCDLQIPHCKSPRLPGHSSSPRETADFCELNSPLQLG